MGEVSLGLAPVNDAPFIEVIEYGRPIYGYQWSLEALYDGEGYVSGYQWQLNAVRNQATANMLSWQTGVIASPQWWSGGGDTRPAGLVDADGNRMTFSYYRNGSMRPIAWDNRDATEIYTDDYGNPSYMALRRPGAEQRACDRLRHRRSVGPNHVQYRKRTCPRACGGACLCAVLGVCLYINPKYAYQYAVFEPGAWQYFAHPGDEYTGADPFTVTVTGADGASTTVTLTPQHYNTSLGGGRKPVALDLDGNGLQFVNLDNSNVYFDVNGDGWREHIAWVAPEDGLLALDLEGDGVIDRIEEISFVAYQPGARTDLEGLRAFDTDGNGVLDRLGARWGEFGVWQDRDSDGISDAGEFQSLDAMGITEIGLTSDGVVQGLGDVSLFGCSAYTTQDGATHAVGDAMFRYTRRTQLPAENRHRRAPACESHDRGGRQPAPGTCLHRSQCRAKGPRRRRSVLSSR